MAGSLLHDALKRLASPFAVRIHGGPLAGAKWIAATGRRFTRGTYEQDTANVIKDLVAPGQVVYDIGAHAGYFTVLFSVCVGPTGRVIAFEPRPVNLHYLNRHLALNRCQNVEVMACAVADREGESRFDLGTGTGTGHLSDTGPLSVKTVTLDRLVGLGCIPAPDFVKIDAEGAEHRILEGARDVITNCRPAIIVEVHGQDVEDRVRTFLGGLGYRLTETGGPSRIAAIPAPPESDSN